MWGCAALRSRPVGVSLRPPFVTTGTKNLRPRRAGIFPNNGHLSAVYEHDTSYTPYRHTCEIEHTYIHIFPAHFPTYLSCRPSSQAPCTSAICPSIIAHRVQTLVKIPSTLLGSLNLSLLELGPEKNVGCETLFCGTLVRFWREVYLTPTCAWDGGHGGFYPREVQGDVD